MLEILLEMGVDLFGSFAESTCAALVFVAATADLIRYGDGVPLYFSLLISAFGILACVGSSTYGIFGPKVIEIGILNQHLSSS